MVGAGVLIIIEILENCAQSTPELSIGKTYDDEIEHNPGDLVQI